MVGSFFIIPCILTTISTCALAEVLRLFEAKHGRRPTEQNDADNFLDLSHKAFADNGLPADFISDDALR